MSVGVCTIPRAIRILGTGVARPSCQVESSELDTLLNLPEGTVQRRSGVRVRYVETRRTAASLGAEAARCALAAARLTLDRIDCVVAASGSMDQAMPCNAALIHRELGLGASGVAAFDINASCLGFLAALDTLSWPLLAGGSRHHPSRCGDDTSNGGARRAADYLTLAQFRMDGQAVFHLVARHLDEFVDALVRGAGPDRGDLTLVIPHQA